MTRSPAERGGVSLGQAAVYRIVVQGVLADERLDRLGGLRLQAGPREHGGSTTVLTGRLTDQAQLIGVVNTLYDLRLPILVVEMLELG